MSIDNVIQIIVGVAVTGTCGYVVSIAKKLYLKMHEVATGTVANMKYTLLQIHGYHKPRGKISKNTRAVSCEIYDCYKALGGNGLIDSIMGEIRGFELE
jgi:hypothetical protein